MDYMVVYTSQTGNTEKVAMKIFAAIPGKSKDIRRLEELDRQEAAVYFVGFWNDRGTCGSAVMDFLSSLHGKKVALFGTSGMGGSVDYFKQVENRVSVFLPDDNEYLGCFLCSGRMMPQVLEKYKQMRAVNDTPQIRGMIAAYEEGMLHPDEQDLKNAGDFVRKVLDL